MNNFKYFLSILIVTSIITPSYSNAMDSAVENPKELLKEAEDALTNSKAQNSKELLKEAEDILTKHETAVTTSDTEAPVNVSTKETAAWHTRYVIQPVTTFLATNSYTKETRAALAISKFCSDNPKISTAIFATGVALSGYGLYKICAKVCSYCKRNTNSDTEELLS